MLGYQAMQQKIRQVHDLQVPRDLVHAVMFDIDLEGLEERTSGVKKKKGQVTLQAVAQTECTQWTGMTS